MKKKILGYSLFFIVLLSTFVLWRNYYPGPTKPAAAPEVASGEVENSDKGRLTEKSTKRLPAKMTFDAALKKIISTQRPSRRISVTQDLERQLSETKRILLLINNSDSAVASGRIKGQLESKIDELTVLRDEVNRKIRLDAEQLGEQTHTGVEAYLQEVNQRFNRVITLLQGVVSTENSPEVGMTVAKTLSYLDSLKKPEPNLGIPEPTVRAPSTIVIDSQNAQPPAYVRRDLTSYVSAPDNSILWGIMGIGTVSAAPAAPDAEAMGCNYTAADLAESGPEIIFDQRILDLAEKLHYDPLEIYDYVSNEITYQEYYGSMKGALGTLISGSGNATDQASLLSALLRVSQIPTRYVTGTIDFETSDDRGRNWVKVKANAAFAKVAPNGSLFDSGQRYGMIKHVWIEACVPYDNYRGSAADRSGYQWVPLDASYEQHEFQQGVVVPSGFSLDDFLYGSNGYMLSRSNQMPHEAFEEALAEQLAQPVVNAGYAGIKKKTHHDILPNTLPYRVRSFSQWGDGIVESETAFIPPGHRLSLSVLVKNSNGSILHPAIRFDMPEAALKRITLRFDSETQNNIDYTACPVSENVIPVIALEGVDQVATGKSSVDLCSEHNILQMFLHYGTDLTLPNKRVNSVTYTNIGAFNYHSLQSYALQASKTVIDERSDRLLDTVGQISDPSDFEDETLGEYLHLVGFKFMDYITRANVRVSSLYGGFGTEGKHLGITSTRKSVEYLFDLPFGISGNGFLIDVRAGVGGTYDVTTGDFLFDSFLLWGYTASAYESYIWQEMGHLDAVSSVRGIQYAYENGEQVARLQTGDVLAKPWDAITLANSLYYLCPEWDGYTKPNVTAIGCSYNDKDIVCPVNFNSLGYKRLSSTDTSKTSVKGVMRYGYPFERTISYEYTNGHVHTCNLITPESQLPRNPLDDDPDAALGYSESILQNLGDRVLGGEIVTIPIKKIVYVDSENTGSTYNKWLGTIYISAYDDGENSTATFAITGDYVAGGGFALGWPKSFATYIPALNTGYTQTLSSSTVNSLTVDSGTYQTTDFECIDQGATGSNAGYIEGNSTLSRDPVNLVSGNMYHPETDIVLKGRGGLNITFDRTYNSNVRKDGPFGYGWTHSFNHFLKFFDTDQDGLTDQVIWGTGNGANNRFDVSGAASGIPLNQVLDNQDGLYVVAKRENSGEYSIKEKNGLRFFFENISGAPDTTARLLRIVDRNGNTLRLSYSGAKLTTVSDDLNRALNFHYDDGNGHITRIVDWSGRTHRYLYDADNNLQSHETPLAVQGESAPTSYSYYTDTDGINLDHAMESYSNPNGDGMTFEYYVNGHVFRHTDQLGQSSIFRYNQYRRETTVIDEKGDTQTYLFNEWGQQLRHIQGDGSKNEYEYNDERHPLNETVTRHALGYRIEHEYDDDGDLIKSTMPDGSTLQYFGKTAHHKYCTAKDPRGNYTLSRYDGNGNLTQSIVLKSGVSLSQAQASDCNYSPPAADILAWNINSYDSVGNLLTSKRVRDFTTGAGPYVEYVYDSNSLNPVTIRRCGIQHDANDNLLSHCQSVDQQFDALGRPTKSATQNLYHQEYEYDADGRVTRSTDSNGEWRDFTYDNNGNLLGSHLLGMGDDGKIGMQVYDTIEYDQLNRPVLKRNKAGHASRISYDEIGNIVEIANPDGFAIRFEYDAMNRPIRAFDEHGHDVQTQYDVGGRPISVRDPNGLTTTYEYYGAQENGRLKLVTSPDGRTLQYFYDNNGNVIKTLDNLGRETLTDFDSLSRPVRSVGPVHLTFGLGSIRQVTVTTYNELGYIEKISAGYTTVLSGATGGDVLADQAVYQYDDFGRLVSEADAAGKITRKYYDEHGNLKRIEAPNGHTASYTYDHARHGLLLTKTAKLDNSDPSPHVTQYNYNVLGQVTRVTVPEVTYQYGYDEANRLNSVNDGRGDKTLSYDYTPGGLLNSVSDSDGKRTDFLYDAASRLTAMLASNGDRVNFVFDAGGRLRETSMPDGYSAQYKYDEGGNLIHLFNSTIKGTVSRHDYSYDAAGRRETHLETIAGTTTSYKYAYDNLDRVTSVMEDGGATLVEEYGYDQFNNRRMRHPNGGSTYYYLHDANHQLNEVRAGSDTGQLVASFQYDDSGNLLHKTEGAVTRDFTYDALDRLQKVEGSDIATETYAYDQQGRRIEKNVGSATTRYTYSGLSIWAEFDETWNQAIAYYNYSGTDQALIRSTPNGSDTRYYHNDGLGSAVAVTDQAGFIQESSRYDSWGNLISGGGIPQYGFTGREPDSSGLIYYRSRYYDPTLGRFTQRDPSGFGGGLNPYVYVTNSPQNFTDPLGLSKNLATANSSLNSHYRGASHNPDGSLFNTNCPGSCHGTRTMPNGAITTAKDAAFVKRVLYDFTLGMTVVGGIAAGVYDAFTAPGVLSIGSLLLEAIPGPNIFKQAKHLDNAAGAIDVPKGADNLPVPFDGEFATKQLLGTSTTPAGRQLNFHAADRMANPPKGRVPMTPAEVDQVLDGATNIRKRSFHPQGNTLTIQNKNMPGKPQVIVDEATGTRVITVVNPKRGR